MNQNVLIIVAHSDDEALGCGGTIARHVSEGDSVSIVYMADGTTSRELSGSKEAKNRLDDSQKARQILGITKAFFLEFPDNQMDSLPLLSIVKALEPIIQKIEPEIIYTHHHGDLNIDHQITHQAVLTACRPQPNSSVKQIYCFEVMSSTEWNSPDFSPFLPTAFVDITNFLETKIKAVRAYHSEMRDPPHSRSIEHTKILASHRGHCIGVQAAEAFMLCRYLR